MDQRIIVYAHDKLIQIQNLLYYKNFAINLFFVNRVKFVRYELKSVGCVSNASDVKTVDPHSIGAFGNNRTVADNLYRSDRLPTRPKCYEKTNERNLMHYHSQRRLQNATFDAAVTSSVRLATSVRYTVLSS